MGTIHYVLHEVTIPNLEKKKLPEFFVERNLLESSIKKMSCHINIVTGPCGVGKSTAVSSALIDEKDVIWFGKKQTVSFFSHRSIRSPSPDNWHAFETMLIKKKKSLPDSCL